MFYSLHSLQCPLPWSHSPDVDHNDNGDDDDDDYDDGALSPSDVVPVERDPMCIPLMLPLSDNENQLIISGNFDDGMTGEEADEVLGHENDDVSTNDGDQLNADAEVHQASSDEDNLDEIEALLLRSQLLRNMTTGLQQKQQTDQPKHSPVSVMHLILIAYMTAICSRINCFISVASFSCDAVLVF